VLAERGVDVDHVTIYRWVQRFTPLLADAARPCRRQVGDRWQVDERYMKVARRWRYVYRAIDQFRQVIDVLVSVRRDAAVAHRFFVRAIGATKVTSIEVTADQAPVYPAVLEGLLPAWHPTDRYANNRIECDHGRLKARLRTNAVALWVWRGSGSSDGDGLGGWLGRLGPVAVSGFLDPEVGHLAFDDAGLAAQASCGQQVGEQVISQPHQRSHQALRGKTPPARR
jgi:transposase-like protein